MDERAELRELLKARKRGIVPIEQVVAAAGRLNAARRAAGIAGYIDTEYGGFDANEQFIVDRLAADCANIIRLPASKLKHQRTPDMVVDDHAAEIKTTTGATTEFITRNVRNAQAATVHVNARRTLLAVDTLVASMKRALNGSPTTRRIVIHTDADRIELGGGL